MYMKEGFVEKPSDDSWDAYVTEPRKRGGEPFILSSPPPDYPHAFVTEYNGTTNSCEYESGGAILLDGLALVRRDLGEFPEEPEFNFPCKIEMIHNTGSRPWCVVNGVNGLSWETILERITDDYAIHVLRIDAGDCKLSKGYIDEALKLVREDIDKFSKVLGDVSVYKEGDGGIVIISHQHLSPQWAASVMATVQERLDEVRPQGL